MIGGNDMCGRYLIDDETYADIWKILSDPDMMHEVAKGEVFPTNVAPVITLEGAAAIKWGFPHWKGTGVIINARAETALEKRMFFKPLMERRCVIPSSGFYEWSKVSGTKKKQKHLFRTPGEHTLNMAGMVNVFRDAQGREYRAFVILTTAANDSVAPVHDRMPVILMPDEQDRWISDIGYVSEVLHRPGIPLLCEKVS